MKSTLPILVLAAMATSADADILFCLGNGQCGGSGDVENVLLRKDTSGSTVFGDTNQTQTEIFFHTDQTNGGALLSIPASGQARIEGLGGGQITDLTFGATDPQTGFLKTVFNIDTLADTTVQLTGTDQHGTDFNFVLNAIGSGQNFVTAYTVNDQWIDTITMVGNGIVAIEDLQQVRVGPGTFPSCPDCEPNPTGVVPVPAAAWLFGTGLLGLAGIARQRKYAG